MVVLAIAVFLVYAGQAANRVVREARIARVKANAEVAYYAAEAGFNRARAKIIGRSPAGALGLNGQGESLAPGGTYLLAVTYDDARSCYQINSEGRYGQGRLEAIRTVSGCVRITATPPSPQPYRVHTIYDR